VPSEESRSLLRHTLATAAYRGRKVVAGVPSGFAEFRIAAGSRTPGDILAHIGDLLDWALSLADGPERWQNSAPLEWERETTRFFHALEKLDRRLGNEAPIGCSSEGLFQGPIADMLSHIGQLAMLRRLAGAPVRAENYFIADICAGRVGREQPPPKAEWD
jgi:hypothetical protein